MSLPRLGSLEHLSLVRLCKANAPRSGMIWKDSHSEKSKSSWIILDCVSSDGFHHHVSLFCSLPCSMIRPLPDAFFERCFRILRRAQRQKPERRDRRDLEPYPALTGAVWASLESENHGRGISCFHKQDLQIALRLFAAFVLILWGCLLFLLSPPTGSFLFVKVPNKSCGL